MPLDKKTENVILQAFEILGCEIHNTAKEKGWWDGDKERPMGDQFANFHAELSEAWECYRILSDVPAPFYIDGNTGKPEGIATELADCIIRILDTCKRYNWPLAQALLVKMEYNETRPYRHGNKLA